MPPRRRLSLVRVVWRGYSRNVAQVGGEQAMEDAKVKEAVIAALHKAATRNLSADEVSRQRLSFVMGTLKSDSDATRERVRKALATQDGC